MSDLHSDADPSTGDGAAVMPLFTIWTEKVTGRGEDSNPIARVIGAPRDSSPPGRSGDPHSTEGAVVAVFDGMGGSGSSLLVIDGEEQSQARTAARLARQTVQAFVGAYAHLDIDLSVDVLTTSLVDSFESFARSHHIDAGRIRSKLIRVLPTTLALGRWRRSAGHLRYEALWAGDSRVYLLTPSGGLQQLSTDDLKSRGDALDNLLDDSPLSNALWALQPFAVNMRVVEPDEQPAVLIAATDGCFGYLPTPWHFEHLLLSALAAATSMGQWRDAVREQILAVTGDDASMALTIIGASTLTSVQKAFARRTREVDALVARFSDVVDRHEAARHELVKFEHEIAELRREQWHGYRRSYERWLTESARRGSPAAVVERETLPAGRRPEPALTTTHGAEPPVACPHCGAPTGMTG